MGLDPEKCALAARQFYELCLRDCSRVASPGITPRPDDCLDGRIESLILEEAQRLARLPSWRVQRRWHGVYTLHSSEPPFARTIDDRIHILTGIGGKGMTTGPALALEQIQRLA